MAILGYILGTVIIAVVVALTAYFLIKRFLENEQKKMLLELKFNSKSLVTPLRIQAYERLALFLERIDPNQLILRLNNPELSAGQFKSLLLATIRAEYDHNLSQQIFVSSEVWERIIQVKEETIKLVNLCAGKLSPDAKSFDLAALIIEQVAEKAPNANAMELLKEEVRLLF